VTLNRSRGCPFDKLNRSYGRNSGSPSVTVRVSQSPHRRKHACAVRECRPSSLPARPR
jgi:hypothetical protein